MKLKTEYINGFCLLVDEVRLKNPKIGDIVFDNDFNDKICYTVNQDYLDLGKECFKVIAAEAELNLDVPILPNWREFELNNLVKDNCHPNDSAKEDGIKIGYNHNKDEQNEIIGKIKYAINYRKTFEGEKQKGMTYFLNELK